MTDAAPIFRATRFAAPERERAFRLKSLRADARVTAIAFSILAVDVALFAFTDRALFGASAQFFQLIATRGAVLLATVAFVVAAGRAASPERFDRLALALALAYAAMTLYVDATRPRSYFQFIVPEIGLQYAAWTFFSARFLYQATAALAFGAASLTALVVFRDPLPAPSYLAIVIAFASANVIGAINSWRLLRARRLEWLRSEELSAARHAAEEANRAKTLFLGMVSHEVLSPLGGIVAAVEELRRTGSAGESALATVGAEAAALHGLLRDVLDLARGEAVQPVIARRPTAPADLVREVVRALSGFAEAKGLAVGYAAAPDVPEAVASDPGRLRQILINLGTNAVRSTERGRVDFLCEARRRPGQGMDLRFEVRDTGPGIAPGDLPSVFEPFWRRPAGGAMGRAGLGLAISRLLAEGMGGRLEVESVPGSGTCFRLVLPSVEPCPPGAAEGPPPVHPVDPALAAEARELAEVPHAARVHDLAERAQALAARTEDAALARWAADVRAAADRVDASALTALLSRFPGQARDP